MWNGFDSPEYTKLIYDDPSLVLVFKVALGAGFGYRWCLPEAWTDDSNATVLTLFR
jgi:hypothetical protein